MKEKERELQDQFQLLEQEYSNLLMRYTELSANKL